jgi:hypothetical protein
MTTWLTHAAAAGALIAAATATPLTQSATDNQLTPAEKKAGWTLLFDGKSLDGWRGYKRQDASGTRWKVENGALTLPPKDGQDTRGARDIISTATYDRFELSFDFRVAEGANSGVKYYVLEDLDAAIGHEYQIIDDERHPDAKVGLERQTASFYDVMEPKDRKLKKAGEWNTGRVVAMGPTVEHWLNGSRVLSYELGSPELRKLIADSKFKDVARFGTLQKGHILLQDHGDQVWFRNVKVRRLAGATQP